MHPLTTNSQLFIPRLQLHHRPGQLRYDRWRSQRPPILIKGFLRCLFCNLTRQYRPQILIPERTHARYPRKDVPDPAAAFSSALEVADEGSFAQDQVFTAFEDYGEVGVAVEVGDVGYLLLLCSGKVL